MLLLLYRWLIVNGSPESWSKEKRPLVCYMDDLLEEKDVWFWFVDFVMLPSQTLTDAQLVAARGLNILGRTHLCNTKSSPFFLPK